MSMYELFLNMNNSPKREKLKWYRITCIVMKWLIQILHLEYAVLIKTSLKRNKPEAQMSVIQSVHK